MRKQFLLSLVLTLSSATVMAQSNPAVKSPAPAVTGQPAEGANSFTETQAKERIEKAGFTSVGALTKDPNGIWMGKASKNGATTDVSLDFKGNVTAK
jgi:hypothetical protein